MSLHTEIHFEDEIAEYLGQHGWLYEDKVSAKYDRARALFPEDVIAWVQESQPEAWQALARGHGLNADTRLLERLRQEMDARGTLDVLRTGIELFPVKSKIALAQFRPASGINQAILTRYEANRLRVVRQVRYSESNENCLDLAFFLNGLPVATVELKSDFTQCVQDAVDQYRFDRHPQPKGQKPEPMLSFPSGALVHFAVSNSEAMMTTRLAGTATKFLPFNQGDGHAAGNPPSGLSGSGGHRTSYLWQEVWGRTSFLEILGRYLVTRRDDKKKLSAYVFPRYHQLAVTRKLLQAVKTEGAGGKYLIQHSAGSGKTNSIAWTAHFFADLHDANHRKVFDSVIVVSDRNVIDQQLQDAIFDFERTKGVVTSIKGEGGSKGKELAEALSGEKKIVVCTIQTFPALYTKMKELVTHTTKRFAVIADEAHSSQTGEAATKLKQVLTAEEWAEVEDGGEIGIDDLLRAQMTSRVTEQAITYVAFTATPKAKTLELFGRRANPKQPAGPENLPEAFHVYSMRQAIEEGFILDVLKNYTTYKMAWKIAHDGKEYDDVQVERSTAIKGIMRWVRLHPYNIAQKVQVVVEHYLHNVQPLLNGHAKAMVVVGSRKEAVRWQLAMQKYIQKQGYDLRALVAFSGEVEDKESGEEPFKETSAALNSNLRGREIAKAFDTEEYQILLVANKFQTGFDQPLLCGMYVDKRLGGIQAVQTLSRLNRCYSGKFGDKDTTFVLDFVNDAEEVLAAFKTYYETATLEDVTDPNLVYNLRAKLDAAGHYDDFEVDRAAEADLNPKAKQSDLVRALEPIADRLMRQFKTASEHLKVAKEAGDDAVVEEANAEVEALHLFKRDMTSFGLAYTFLSQIFDYANTALAKRAIFYKRLIPLLEFGRDRAGVDLSKVVLTHHTLRNRGRQGMPLVEGESPLLKPLTDAGSGSVQEKERQRLSEIIAKVNDLFGADTTDGDKLVYVNSVLKGKLMESETLRQQAVNNSKGQFANSPDLDDELANAIMDASAAMSSLSKEALESEHVRRGLKEVLLGPAQLYEALRAITHSTPPTV